MSSSHQEIRSFGRRRARPLSARQQRLMRELLPQLLIDTSKAAPATITELFEPNIKTCWLEIGFGGGEHLIAAAREMRNVGFIGCEPFEDGVAKTLSEIETHNLKNVRLFVDDVRHLLGWLPANSIRRTIILFPDPWPKRRHHKRRLVNQSTLAALACVMPPGAQLRIATDIGDYVRTTFVAIHANGKFLWCARKKADWEVPPDDWIPTRYEKKAKQQRRRRYYFDFERQTKIIGES